MKRGSIELVTLFTAFTQGPRLLEGLPISIHASKTDEAGKGADVIITL